MADFYQSMRTDAGHVFRHPLHSEDGFVLVLAMMILVIVSMLGIAATTTSVFEMNIAGNEKWSQEQFFQADSAINEFIARNITPKHPADLAYNPASPPAGLTPLTLPTTCSVLEGPPPYNAAHTPLYTAAWTFDPDNPTPTVPDSTGTVDLFYLKKVSGTGSGPQVVEIMACAKRGNTVASLLAGIEVGLPPGAIPTLNKVGYN